ncbi:MAG: chitobiase/beta-hexosaminidase C-terminal domain-containing protein [Muribaculaceae bacterium]|nr:chitobiase/beta-hexosaminidase C-terminal domain-containing protein [Muribaculaceae bacterium]
MNTVYISGYESEGILSSSYENFSPATLTVSPASGEFAENIQVTFSLTPGVGCTGFRYSTNGHDIIYTGAEDGTVQFEGVQPGNTATITLTESCEVLKVRAVNADKFASDQVEVGPYTKAGSSESVEYTFYVDASQVSWTPAGLYIFDGWSGFNNGHLGSQVLTVTSVEGTNKIYKFSFTGGTNAGKMIFTEDAGGWSGAQTVNIDNVQNGKLYKILNAKDGNNYKVDGPLEYTPVVGPDPVVPAAPVPSHDASLVKSVYSDTYASSGMNFELWGSASTGEKESLSGNEAFKFMINSYFGLTLPAMNVSDMKYLHVDLYAMDDMTANIYAISLNPTVDTEKYSQAIEKGKWVSLDIPLTAFPNVDKSKIEQFKFDGGNGQTFYLDNLYFWTEPDNSLVFYCDPSAFGWAECKFHHWGSAEGNIPGTLLPDGKTYKFEIPAGVNANGLTGMFYTGNYAEQTNGAGFKPENKALYVLNGGNADSRTFSITSNFDESNAVAHYYIKGKFIKGSTSWGADNDVVEMLKGDDGVYYYTINYAGLAGSDFAISDTNWEWGRTFHCTNTNNMILPTSKPASANVSGPEQNDNGANNTFPSGVTAGTLYFDPVNKMIWFEDKAHITATPKPGTYTWKPEVKLTFPKDAQIYYRTDGQPVTNSGVFDGQIFLAPENPYVKLEASTTITARAYDAATPLQDECDTFVYTLNLAGNEDWTLYLNSTVKSETWTNPCLFIRDNEGEEGVWISGQEILRSSSEIVWEFDGLQSNRLKDAAEVRFTANSGNYGLEADGTANGYLMTNNILKTELKNNALFTLNAPRKDPSYSVMDFNKSVVYPVVSRTGSDQSTTISFIGSRTIGLRTNVAGASIYYFTYEGEEAPAVPMINGGEKIGEVPDFSNEFFTLYVPGSTTVDKSCKLVAYAVSPRGYVSENPLVITYIKEAVARPDHELYIIGAFNKWAATDFRRMFWDGEKGYYYYRIPNGGENRQFKIVIDNPAWLQQDHTNEFDLQNMTQITIGNDKPYLAPASEPAAANMVKVANARGNSAPNLALPASVGDVIVHVSADFTKVWYHIENHQSYEHLYIRANFIEGTGNWGTNAEAAVEMTWDPKDELWSLSWPTAVTGGQFMLSSVNGNSADGQYKDFWNKSNAFKQDNNAGYAIPAFEPHTSNVEIGREANKNFTIECTSGFTIYFDPNNDKLYYSPDTDEAKTVYIGARFITRKTGKWFDTVNLKKMQYDNERGLYFYDAIMGGRFNFSEFVGEEFLKHCHLGIQDEDADGWVYSYTIPNGRPDETNLLKSLADLPADMEVDFTQTEDYHFNLTGNRAGAGEKENYPEKINHHVLIMPEAGRIYFDRDNHMVWYEPTEVTWADFKDIEVYLRGMLLFGGWAGEGSNSQDDYTMVMHRVESTPGLWYQKISKDPVEVNLLANPDKTIMQKTWYNTDFEQDGSGTLIHERYHYSFSTGKYNGNYGDSFWCNATRPASGSGRMQADGTAEPFIYGNEWSQNYIFDGEGTLYVDLINGISWIEPFKTEESDVVARFTFWDKGGDRYKQYADKYNWWYSNRANRRVHLELRDAAGNTLVTGHTYTDVADDDEWLHGTGSHMSNNTTAGMDYNIELPLGKEFFKEGTDLEKATRADMLDGYLWVVIEAGVNDSRKLVRPYVRNAVYTQGPVSDEEFNKYREITLYEDAEYIDVDVQFETIKSNINFALHHGGVDEDQIVKYDEITRFATYLDLGGNDETAEKKQYSFSMPGSIEEVRKPVELAEGGYAEDENGNIIYKVYGEEVVGKVVDFKRNNNITVTFSGKKEAITGQTGKVLIYGVDYVNGSDKDDITVKVTYSTEGMSFDRSKVFLVSDLATKRFGEEDIIPRMVPHETSDNEPSVDRYSAFLGGSCDGSKSVLDVIMKTDFSFRPEMIMSFPAYIGYDYLGTYISDPDDAEAARRDHNTVNDYAATYGVPLTWAYTSQSGRAYEPHDAEWWHKEAYTNRSLTLQIHHIECGDNASKVLESLKDKNLAIRYRLVVPVVNTITFLNGTRATTAYDAVMDFQKDLKERIAASKNPASLSARRRAISKAPDAAAGYTGSITVGKTLADGSLHPDQMYVQTQEVAPEGLIVTGVENIQTEDVDAPVEYYNIQGMRVQPEHMTPGMYIRRQGKSSMKIYVR